MKIPEIKNLFPDDYEENRKIRDPKTFAVSKLI